MKTTTLLTVLLFLFSFNQSYSQEIASGDLQIYVQNIIDLMPRKGTGEYISPNANQKAALNSAVNQVMGGQFSSANATLLPLGYKLVQFTDFTTSTVYSIIEKQYTSSNYWGTYIFNNNATRQKMMIESPHPLIDSHTGGQGIYMFKELNARFYALSGTHRCNSIVESPCSGTTNVCGNPDSPFQESDAPHNVGSAFYSTIAEIESKVNSLIHIQLHGFAYEEGDPDMYLSNGTLFPPVFTDYLTQLRTELLVEDDTLDISVAHDGEIARLAGTTNVIGRLVNGTTDPCSTASSNNSGRFFHLEQIVDLRINQTGWQKVRNALINTFPEDNNGNTEVNYSSNTIFATEGVDPSIEIKISIENPSTTVSTTVDIELTGSQADFGGFVSQQVIFQPGQTTDETIVVPITDDTILEPTRKSTFVLKNPSGGNNAQTGYTNALYMTLEDDEPIPEVVVISEVHADPSLQTNNRGDANRDGMPHSSEDQFVEIVNLTEAPLGLSGFSLWDIHPYPRQRHVFPTETVLPPGGVIVVFGGGMPVGTFGGSMVQTASSGTLELTKTYDRIELRAPDSVIYSHMSFEEEGNDNQSLTLLSPDFAGILKKHLSVSEFRFSPGTTTTGAVFAGILQHLILNEVHADPHSNIEGDANGDGTRDSSEDEFLEFVNTGNDTLDLSDFELYDLYPTQTLRHIFEPNTRLAPGNALVLFGGGTPTGTFGGSMVQTASTSQLELTNSQDTIEIRGPAGNTDFQYFWGSEAENNQAITRSPDITGEDSPMALHSSVSTILYSPGTKIDGTSFLGSMHLIINEVHADPKATIAGDANGDGVSDASEDEFLEFLNTGIDTLNLSGYELYDLHTPPTLRHVFEPNTYIAPGKALVLFGGGVPIGNFGGSAVQIASSGSLDLTEAADTIEVRKPDGTIDLRFFWANEGNNDQSITRSPDRTGSNTPMALHEIAPGASGALFSPGVQINGEDFSLTTLVSFTTDSLYTNESEGVINLSLTITNPDNANATTVSISITGGTGHGADLNGYTVQEVNFPAGNGDDQTLLLTITNDNHIEGTEYIQFELQDITGGNYAAIGSSSVCKLYIKDNDPPLVINEVHADPDPTIAGDANGDGMSDPSDDEFVELVNIGGDPLDLTGYTLWDTNPTNNLRHTFEPGSIIPSGGAIVVFGGGTPTGDFGNSVVQTATSGTLGLTDGQDTLNVISPTGVLALQQSWGVEGNDNQSITWFPDMSDSVFIKHSTVSPVNALYSPGNKVDGTSFGETQVNFTTTTTSTNEEVRIVSFEIEIDNPSFGVATTVDIVLTSGDISDFTHCVQQVTFPAGNSANQTVTLCIADDELVEGVEDFEFTLQNVQGGSNASIGNEDTHTLAINDNDIAELTIIAAAESLEDSTDGSFIITTTKQFDTQVEVSFTVNGSATEGLDYSTLGTMVNFPQFTDSISLPVAVMSDTFQEWNETVVITLTGTDNSNVVPANSPNDEATVIIRDNDVSTLSIRTTAGATENGSNGVFTIFATRQFENDVIVDMIVSGTALEGVDYSPINTSFVFPAFSDTKIITIDDIDDNLVEGSETVIISLTGTNNPGVTISETSSNSMVISDDDTAEISIEATTQSTENGSDGVFTINTTKQFTDTLTIDMIVFGVATKGVDFVDVGTAVVFPANSNSTTINIVGIDDNVLEGNETVMIKLSGIADTTRATIAPAPNDVSTILMYEDDTAEFTIEATNNPTENGTGGLFTIMTTNPIACAILVDLIVSGTGIEGMDYTAIGTTFLFPANSTTATIPIAAIDDNLTEGDETIIVTLTGTEITAATIGVTDNATVTISDNDQAVLSIATTTPSTENGPDGLFTVTTSNPFANTVTVSMLVSGTGIEGVDYMPVGSSFEFPPNNNTATIAIKTINDELIEGDEDIIVLLTGTNSSSVTIGSPDAASLTITDDENPIYALVINEFHSDPKSNIDGDANGDGIRDSQDDEFIEIVNNSLVDADLTGCTLYDSENKRHEFNSIVPAGEAIVVFGGGIINNFTGNFGNAVIVTASQGRVSLTNSGDLIVLRDPLGDTIQQVVVGVEYAVNQSVTHDPDISGITFDNHSTANGSNGALYSPGRRINGDPFTEGLGTLSIEATDQATENGSDGLFTVSTTTPFDNAIVVNIDISGTAQEGNDYAVIGTSFVFPANTTTALITIADIDDNLVEGNETINISLVSTGTPGVTIGSTDSATLNINDDDTATLSISATTQAAENTTNGLFTISTDKEFTTPATISLAVSGTAVNGTDYTTISTSVDFPANNGTITIPVVVIADNYFEPDETVIISMIETDNPGVVIDNIESMDLVTITDDDVSISLVINELHIDPSSGLAGDANGDGIRDSGDDEFIEIVNTSAIDVDLTGYTLHDSEYKRHDFTSTVPAGEAIVIFGGGIVDDFTENFGNSIVVTASKDKVSLSNAGDRIVLRNPLGDTISQVIYGGDFNVNQSVTLDPDITGLNFINHTIANGSGGTLFSPGRKINGDPFTEGLGTLSIESTTQATENGSNGEFIISTNTPFTNPVLVSISVSGTATEGIDYTAIGTSFLFPANTDIFLISIEGINDNLIEEEENVTITLTGTDTQGVLIGGMDNASVAIIDDDVLSLVINELHVDPKSSINGDANGDGIRDSGDDEFIEIVNNSVGDVDLTGYTIYDSQYKRHVFNSVVPAGEAIVVFGGGDTEDFTGDFGNAVLVTASTGKVSLNNSGDRVVIRNPQGDTVKQVIYNGEFNVNQSVTLDPDIVGITLVNHSTASGSEGALFSPGTKINGDPFTGGGGARLASANVSEPMDKLKKTKEIIVYPNPAESSKPLYISGIDDYERVLFMLFDLSGKVVHKKTITRNMDAQLSVGILKNGLYIYRLIDPADNTIIHFGKMTFKSR